MQATGDFIFTETLKRDPKWIGIVSFLGSRRHRPVTFFSRNPFRFPFAVLFSTKAHVGFWMAGRRVWSCLSLLRLPAGDTRGVVPGHTGMVPKADGCLLFVEATSCRSPFPVEVIPPIITPTAHAGFRGTVNNRLCRWAR